MTKIVVGSSLSAVVAVNQLSKKHDVKWLQTSPKIGGHLAGTVIEDFQIDLGMVVLEPYSESNELHTGKKTPPIRQNGLDLVFSGFQWLEAAGEEFLPITVQSLFRGTHIKDHLIADNLDVLSTLSDAELKLILSELAKLKKQNSLMDGLHPKNKNTSQEFLSMSLKDLLEKNLGPTFFQLLISPWLNRFNREVATFIPARDHRSVWLPFYYPETISQSINWENIDTSFGARPFIVPKLSSIASLVSRLIVQTKKDNVEVLQINDQKIKFTPGTLFLTSTAETAKLIEQELNSEPMRLFTCNLIVVSFLFRGKITEEKILNVVEEGEGPYRITIRNLSKDGTEEDVHTLVSVEYGSFFSDYPDADLLLVTRSILAEMGLRDDFSSHKINRLGLKIPNQKSRELMEGARNRVYASLLENDYFGFPIDFGSSSFNDQILLGLWSANGPLDE